MLDNFTVEATREAVKQIASRAEIERPAELRLRICGNMVNAEWILFRWELLLTL